MDFDFGGKVAVVTGGGGAICGEIAKALALEGVAVAIWDKDFDAATKKADEIRAATGQALALECDVLSSASVERSVEKTLAAYHTVDILVNGAGGSQKEATTSSDLEFFDIDPEALKKVMDLNYMSAVIPSQQVGRVFAKKKSGAILNISSVAGFSPLTRSISYSNGKAATNNFTHWLAVHMADTYSPHIRVNAIAPGFILTEQNRFLLVEKDTEELTERGHQVISSVPMGRLGKPGEIVGAALWLVSDSASFVTGAIIPVDGGFNAFSGV